MQTISVDASPHLESDTANRNGDAPPERVFQRCRRYSRICGFIVAAIGAVAVLADVLAYVLEHLLGGPHPFLRFLSGGFWEGSTEMTVAEGVAFLLCGSNLLLHSSRNGRATRLPSIFLSVSAWIVVLGSSYHFLAYFLGRMLPMDLRLHTDSHLPTRFSVPPMSPLTAFFFLNAGLALLLVRRPSVRARAWTSLLTIVLAMLSAVVLICYGHGVELLKMTVGTHMALLTAAAFAVLSVGLICLLGPNHWPLQPFLGRHARALLLRAFLPVVIVVIVVNAIARSHVDTYLSNVHSKGWQTAYAHLPAEQMAGMVHGMVESDPDVLPRVQVLAYQRTHGDNQAVDDASAEAVQNYWNKLQPLDKWKEFSRYRRNIRQQRMSLFAALMGVLSAGIMVALIGYASRSLGNSLEAAEHTRDRALAEMRKAWDDAEAANEKLRKTNEELSTARDAAETANRTKSQFLANMNHELRTPLNSIILYAEELMDEHQGEAALLGDLQIILDRGKHLVALINDILEHAKLEANMVKLDPTDVSLGELTRDVATTIEPLAEKNGNTIRLECPETLGAMHVDIMRAKQCLLNMLSNANKFTSNGTITLDVSRDTVEGRDWITFRVTDTGIGMTPEQQEMIFQRFIQADASTTRRYGGTGLGLAISRGLSQLMGGNLILEKSQSNVGSTFTMRLPAGPAAETTAVSVSGPAVLVPEADGHNTVLVVDDDQEVRDLLIRQLSKEGFHAVGACGGEDALELARQLHPQVITLDVMMPGMDGWSVLSTLKSDPATADIPVIIVSIIDDKNLGYTLGASEYLVKPTHRDRLIEVLKRFCNFPSSGVALIAEDDSAMREMLRRMLEKENWTVVEATNGREALACVARQRPALILLDLMMPEMDGFEFLTELRHHPEWQAIPVVVITAKDLNQEDRMFLNGSLLLSGCVKRVLQKGAFSRDELLSQVHALIARGAPD